MFYDKLLQTFQDNEESVLNLVMKGFPQISFPPLLYAFVCFINLSEFPSNVQKPRDIIEASYDNMKISSDTMILEMEPVVLQTNEFDCR